MKKVILNYTKSQIDKAGNIFVNKESTIDEVIEALEVLSNWRSYHAPAMDILAKTFKKHIAEISVSESTFVAQRLKRTHSIIIKLERFSGMQLSRMHDIGGIRAVLSNLSQVERLLEKRQTYRSKHKIHKTYNYIENPKTDGYRGIHLVYKMNYQVPSSIEIQIRTQLQHYWATAIEVIDTSQKSSMKLGQGEKKWKDFFKLLSSAFAIKEGTNLLLEHKDLKKTSINKMLIQMMDELDIIGKLTSLSRAFQYIKNKEERIGRKGHYSIIVLDSNENTIRVTTFSSIEVEAAQKKYAEIEYENLKNQNINVVLVNSGDVEKLQKSYPNYFMDTTQLVLRLREIHKKTFF